MSAWPPPPPPALERVELLTPVANRRALEEELRYQGERGRFDHRAEVLEDGTDVLVTSLVIGVREAPKRPRGARRAELGEGAR